MLPFRSRALGLVFASTLVTAVPIAEADIPPAASSSSPSSSSSAVKARFEGGVFRFVGGAAQEQALRQSIHDAVSHMNFIERPIARGRLRDRNPISATVGFHFPAGNVEVARDGKTFRSRDDFSAVPDRAVTGERMQLKQGIQNGHVVQVFTTGEGERRDEFVPSADGRHLTLDVTVRSPRLRQPLRYRLAYAR